MAGATNEAGSKSDRIFIREKTPLPADFSIKSENVRARLASGDQPGE
jgi:hypothetical protein